MAGCRPPTQRRRDTTQLPDRPDWYPITSREPRLGLNCCIQHRPSDRMPHANRRKRRGALTRRALFRVSVREKHRQRQRNDSTVQSATCSHTHSRTHACAHVPVNTHRGLSDLTSAFCFASHSSTGTNCTHSGVCSNGNTPPPAPSAPPPSSEPAAELCLSQPVSLSTSNTTRFPVV